MTTARHDGPQDGAPRSTRTVDGRYVLERELGSGGMAVVYLAHDLKHGRPVAVKVLHRDLAGSVATRRFLNEIAITSRLQHPHILAVLDSGQIDDVPGLVGLPYHVTPYLAGDSLRARLQRERQLPLDDALRIASEVADALAHAHEHEIVHRDIKPENILFSGGHACVADFGIAHALDLAGGDRVTSVGLTVGTPAYMSPEQAAGERDLDGRSDIYSLACVLYEMLAGLPPFVGPTPESVLAQRFTHPPRALAAYRPQVPPAVEAAIARAMAITPADRFATARAFADALSPPTSAVTPAVAVGDRSAARDHTSAEPRVRPTTHTRRVAIAVAAVGVLALGATLARDRGTFGGGDGDVGATAAGDANRWVVIAGEGRAATLTPAVARDHLHDALRHWRDLDLVAASGADTTPARHDAGRIVTLELSPLGDSVQVRATLLDANDRVLRQHAVRVPDAATAHDRYRELATTLLRVAAPPPDTDAGDRGTTSLAAWHAYARGQDARRRWDLASAEREFLAALAADPSYAAAQLWAAQVGAWQRPRSADWRDAAAQAAARADRLDERDALLAEGVHALATARHPAACDAYRRLQRLTPRGDLPWYGLALCQAYDPAVVRDARSASGWSFRGSAHSAALALDSAIARADGAPAFAFALLQDILYVEPARIRGGSHVGQTATAFAAYPSLRGDTLALVPWPLADFAGGSVTVRDGTTGPALRRNAERLDAYLTAWVRRAPGSADALAALALVQEHRELPDPRADGRLLASRSVQAARRASTDPAQRLALAASQVRLLVKEERWADARRLADSLLAAVREPTAEDAEHLVGLAALVGDVQRTARLLALRADAATSPDRALPPAVAAVAGTLAAHAALGVCTDSTRVLERRLDEQIVRHLDGGERARARQVALGNSLALAVPCLGAEAVARMPAGGDRPLVRMQREWAAGRLGAARAQFASLQRSRALDRPGDVALDHTYQEAWLLAHMGDSAVAARHLELPLTALTTLGVRLVQDVPQAAAVARALALRAELAEAAGDHATARRCARAVVALWERADPSLQPLVRRMRALAA